MLKKKIFSLLMVGVLSLGLIGCGGKGNVANEGTSNNSEKVKLTFGIWDVIQESGMKQLVDKFNETNPNIEVEVQVTPWTEYWTKLEAAATGGEMPDVFWMHTNEFSKYASNDMLLDLTELEGTNGYKDFPESLIQLSSFKNKVYGVPKDFDTIALVYNKEIFDNAKVAYPDETWDWAKLVEVSKQLTNKDAGIYGFAAALEDQQGYLPTIAQAGGYVLKDGKSGYEDLKTIEGLQFYVDLSNKYGVSPSLAQLADTNVDTLFQSGKVAMSFLGSWRMSSYASNNDIKDKFDVAVLPKGRERASIINGLSFAGSAKTKHEPEVRKFLSFLASEEAQSLQAESGTAISAREGTSEKWVSTYPNYDVQVFLDMKEYSVPVSTSLTKAKWGNTEREMIKKMMMGEISVEEGAKVIADEMNKLSEAE